jgi:prepilin-type N-terminal cleavage/methylation domain-containing protein
MRNPNRRRVGFTLIELLVVISIMAALFAITALAVSALAPQFSSVTGGDKAALYVGSARQMARRDGVPTGVHFVVGQDNMAREMYYVRQPDDVAVGLYVRRDAVNVARISVPTGSSFPVSPGDYLELYGGGVVRLITAVNAAAATTAGYDDYQLTVNGTANGGADLPDVSANPPVPGVSPTNYRIIRQTQRIDGEAALTFPSNVGADFSAPTWNNNLPLSNPPNYEILFSPGGQVIGQGTTSGMIYVWMRRATPQPNNKLDPDNSLDPQQGKPIIVTIYVRTGAVAQHPVSRKSDPYEFTRDGRASGM